MSVRMIASRLWQLVSVRLKQECTQAMMRCVAHTGFVHCCYLATYMIGKKTDTRDNGSWNE